MWDRGELHVMGDTERIDEDSEGTDNEDIGDEEQEEHQKARAVASLDPPSRREVEDHNVTHIPFRSWCERTEERAEEDTEDERDAEEGTARGSTMVGRPIIADVDRKT